MTPEFIRNLVEKESGIDNILKKTNTQEYVYLRYMVIVLCKDFLFYRLRTHEKLAKLLNFSNQSLCGRGYRQFNDHFNQNWFKTHKDLYIKCTKLILETIEKQKLDTMKEAKDQKQAVLWYLLNWETVTMKDVINDSLFFKFNTRLSEIEGEHGLIANRVREKFTNRFGRKSNFHVYSCIDKEKTLKLYNTLQANNVKVEFQEVN